MSKMRFRDDLFWILDLVVFKLWFENRRVIG